jgi:hypothetical protein
MKLLSVNSYFINLGRWRSVGSLRPRIGSSAASPWTAASADGLKLVVIAKSGSADTCGLQF